MAGALLVLLLTPGTARAQATPPATAAPPTDRLRVFVDCNRCDPDYLRQNVGFVDYVRDRRDADFHVLVTTQATGGSGLSWVVQFLGSDRFQGQSLRLTFNTPPAATPDDQRKAFARVFRLGLAGFAAGTSVSPQLDVTWTRPTAAAVQTHDPWNSWVFDISTNGNVNGEQSSTTKSYYLFLSANRTTDRWKFRVGTNGNLRTNRFVVDDETTTSSTHSWNVNTLVVKSLSPRWSFGATGSVSHSSYSNIDRAVAAAPAIEFDVFPYSESSHKSLTVQYAIGGTAYKYTALTIFDKLHEVVPRQAVVSELGLRQPWGSINVTGSVSQHLTHLDRYRATVYGQTQVRLFKGFSFDVYAQYQRIRDQISLKNGDATEQDVLLQLQQLATGYSYRLSFGVSYRFGSIFNNVVNTRLSNPSF